MENIEKGTRNWRFLSSFWLKVIAIVSMTCDHLGVMFLLYYFDASHPLVYTLRIIGRLALPLFCFMIYEGVMKTKHFGRYALRLGILAIIIAIALAVMIYGNMGFPNNMGNIFMDLFLGAVGVYFLKRKEIYLKFIALIPLAIAILSTAANSMEVSQGIIIHWFPAIFRLQYHYYGILMIYGFYFVSLFKDFLLSIYANNAGVDIESVKETPFDLKLSNLLALIVIFVATIIYYNLNYGLNELGSVQLYAIFSGALLLFYNGKRGYNKKWFQYGSYLYYPLHIGILALIFYLLSL